MNPDCSRRTVNLKVNDRGYNDSNEDDDDDFNDDQALTLAASSGQASSTSFMKVAFTLHLKRRAQHRTVNA